MKPSKQCDDLVKSTTRLHLKAYRRPGEIWRIGNELTINPITGKAVKRGDKITQKQANDMLKKKVDDAGAEISSLLPNKVEKKLSQSNFDALVALYISSGKGEFLNSRLLAYLIEGKLKKVEREFEKLKGREEHKKLFKKDGVQDDDKGETPPTGDGVQGNGNNGGGQGNSKGKP